MADVYSYRAWAEGGTPGFTATTFLNDGLPYDHATRANGLSVPDIQIATVPGRVLGEDGLIQFGEVRGITALEFVCQGQNPFSPPGALQWTLYTINGAATATAVAGTATPNGFTDIAFTASPYVLADAVKVSLRTTIGSLGPITALSLFDFRYYATTAAAQATAALVFGGTAALTATALTTSCECCTFTYAAPPAGSFAFGAGSSGCGFSFSASAPCASLVYADGRQEGCECEEVIPPVVPTATHALMAATAALTFGGTAALSSSLVTLDDFLPAGLRVLLYVDGVTAKGSLIPLTAGQTATGEGTANFAYVGPAGVAATSTYASIAAGRPWFGPNPDDWTAGDVYTNIARKNNARFELSARFDPAFSAGLGYSFVNVTLGQYVASNDEARRLGAMWLMPSPWSVANCDSAYLKLGQNYDGAYDTELETFVDQPGGEFHGLNLAAAFTAGAPTAFTTPYGPSAFAFGCIVPTTAAFSGEEVGQFAWWVNQTAGGVLSPLSTAQYDALNVLATANTAVVPMLSFAGTRSVGDFAYGAPNTSRWGVWLFVEGAMTTAQAYAFATAALLGYRMQGANP